MDNDPLPENIRSAFLKAAAEPIRWPVSCYRLQFNKGFTFRDAEHVLPYLKRLGITDIYSSPYFRAKPGSTHGYDITDYTSLNPELGSEDDFISFSDTLRSLGMGLIMDIVPNHMSIASKTNPWWRDVLENGPASPHAEHFDIDWKPIKEELEGKVIVPVLGGQYGEVLESCGLRLAYGEEGFSVRYYEHDLPIDPSTLNQILEHARKSLMEALDKNAPDLLELQSIITAVSNLPDRYERDPDKVDERYREKEVIKRRITALNHTSVGFRAALKKTVFIFNGEEKNPESFDMLDSLLGTQVYRLAFWQVATEEINYRRFFDINDLAAVRNERPSTFDQSHALVLRHIAEGRITGLRVDHPDGLFDPDSYFSRLQKNCFIHMVLGRAGETDPSRETVDALSELYEAEKKTTPSIVDSFYIIGEKILVGSERLPRQWPISGTTGYSFMNSAGGLFVDSLNLKNFTEVYQRFIRRKDDFQDMLYQKKKLIMNSFMAGEINVLGRALDIISEQDRRFRDFTLGSLVEAIMETIACFPVYRTYVNDSGITDRDSGYMASAIAKAGRFRRDLPSSLFEFLHDVLTLNYPKGPEGYPESRKRQWLEFTMRFQQITGPIMAKGLEDTVFYSYNRLVSLNEVGGNPSNFGTSREAFHGDNIERLKHWPGSLIATSTHDHKRSEDVRARISVLSEMPEAWREHLMHWGRINRKFKTKSDGTLLPDRNDEYLLYQILLGAWPHEGLAKDDIGMEGFGSRIKHYMTKAAREAKTHTTWISPDMEYEDALESFIDRALASEDFMGSFVDIQQTVSFYGMLNSLSQTLLKITCPGVPDFYQGTEIWNLTLVDPDNRLPVDYGRLEHMLAEAEGAPEGFRKSMFQNPDNGRIKLFLTRKALMYRFDNMDLFLEGGYTPLEVSGARGRHIVAFARSLGSLTAIVIVPRLMTQVIPAGEFPIGSCWEDTRVTLPQEMRARGFFKNILTGDHLNTGGAEGSRPFISVQEALSTLPVCLLEGR
ncbi:MAG: malto-oligosyltrehalose synthase [Thermodesulfovibrionales bacterium]|nr:malto-oligosyltrehalose synthase [Thermodesulfovibrionales bacterium]